MRSTSPTGSTPRIKRLPLEKRLLKALGRSTFWWMSLCAGLLGARQVEFWGKSLGSLFFKVSRRHATITLKNLEYAFPEKSSEERMAIAKKVFVDFSIEGFQFFRLLGMNKETISNLVEAKGFENIDAALSKGKGCILLTAHYGNWELLARKLTILGYKINVIARDSDDPGMTGMTTKIRENAGYRVFDRDQPIIGAFRALKKNECLGILPDQNESGGIFVDFFGRPAKTATGPAVLSLKSGAAIVPVFNYRVGRDKYICEAFPALVFEPSGDNEKDIQELTALVTKSIEEQIRKKPEHWLWLHNRWKLSHEAANETK